MFSSPFSIIFLLVGSVAAKKCIIFTVPMNVSARQGAYAVSELETNEEVAFFSQELTTIQYGGNFSERVLTGYETVTGLYNISATFCKPDTDSPSPVVQVLTHGIGFDRSYWNYPYNNFSYSYVDVATDKYNYCTLFYDRLGIANSSHPNPISVVQAPIEVDVLYQLNSMLRHGTLPRVAHAFNSSGSIVNVGHAYGSQLTYALSSLYPTITDAVILTGFSVNDSFVKTQIASLNSVIAALNQPLRLGPGFAPHAATGPNVTLAALVEFLSTFPINLTPSQKADLLLTSFLDLTSGLSGTASFSPSTPPQNVSSGYLTWANNFGNQYNNLYLPGIDPAILFYAESTKQPYTMGELLTLGNVAPATPVSAFAGPVLVVNGVEDSIACGGDCLASVTGGPDGPTTLDAVGKSFPKAKTFDTIALEETGSAINLHFSARGAYEAIQMFLQGEGIVVP